MFQETQRRNFWSWTWRLQGLSLMGWAFPATGAWLGSAGPPHTALGTHGLLPEARWAQCPEQAAAARTSPFQTQGCPWP